MKLIGSNTSPFVRRIRLWLADTPYEYQSLDIFSESGREVLRAHNPTRKIPMLLDGEQAVFDSRIIQRYLNTKLQRDPELSWDDENTLTVIDAANNSYVELLLLARSGVDTQADALFFNLQRERIPASLQTLDEMAGKGRFEDWDYVSICLYCLLDWVQFRELDTFADSPHLLEFQRLNAQQPRVPETDPRLTLS